MELIFYDVFEKKLSMWNTSRSCGKKLRKTFAILLYIQIFKNLTPNVAFIFTKE